MGMECTSTGTRILRSFEYGILNLQTICLFFCIASWYLINVKGHTVQLVGHRITQWIVAFSKLSSLNVLNYALQIYQYVKHFTYSII